MRDATVQGQMAEWQRRQFSACTRRGIRARARGIASNEPSDAERFRGALEDFAVWRDPDDTPNESVRRFARSVLEDWRGCDKGDCGRAHFMTGEREFCSQP